MVDHPVALMCAALEHDVALLDGPVHNLGDAAPLVPKGAGSFKAEINPASFP